MSMPKRCRNFEDDLKDGQNIDIGLEEVTSEAQGGKVAELPATTKINLSQLHLLFHQGIIVAS
jgi:hypothetical protein